MLVIKICLINDEIILLLYYIDEPKMNEKLNTMSILSQI